MHIFLMTLVALFFCGIFASIIWLVISLIRRKGFKKPLASIILCIVLTISFSTITSNNESYQEYLASRPEETEEEISEEEVEEVEETEDEEEVVDVSENEPEVDVADESSDEMLSQYEKLTQDISKFVYEIQDDKVYLTEYSKRKSVLIVQSSYDIDGITYETDLSEFRITGSKVEFVVFEDGITNINTSVFNGSDIKYIYFPESMDLVYDYTLSYLHVDDNEVIQVYYGGSEDSWNNIFTEYERQTVSDAWNSSEDVEEKGSAVGESIADLLNGSSYNESYFSYIYSVSQDEIQEIVVEF